MARAYHLLTIFDTYSLIRREDGTIAPDRLVGYQPPASFEQILNCAEKHLIPLLETTEPRSGGIVMPTDEQLHSASAEEIEQWARHLDSGGKVPPPGEYGVQEMHLTLAQKKDIRAFRRAANSYRQFVMVQTIVEVLVSAQQQWLQSGRWLDKSRLTVRQVAGHVHAFSEKSVERAIKSLKLKLDGRLFAASELLCTSIQPSLCKAILSLPERERGAPAIKQELEHRFGIVVSCRCVGMALDTLHLNALL